MKKYCTWLIGAVILSAAVPTWADSLSIQTSVQLPNGASTTDNPTPCGLPLPCTALSILSNLSGSGAASASTTFGALDAASSIGASGVGPAGGTSADASAGFGDSFSVLGGSGSGTFQITFATTGTTVSAMGDADSEVSLFMEAGGLSASYDVTDKSCVSGCTGTGVTVTGSPITVFSIDASDGDSISFSAAVDANSSVSSGGSLASASDPVSVFITPPAGFTFSTASGTVYPSAPTPTPEPGSLLLLSSGLACLGACGRKMLKRV